MDSGQEGTMNHIQKNRIPGVGHTLMLQPTDTNSPKLTKQKVHVTEETIGKAKAYIKQAYAGSPEEG